MTYNVFGGTLSLSECNSTHGSRGRYDSQWSLLSAVQVSPLHEAPSVCKVCVFIEDAWQLLVTAHVSLLGEPAAVYL